MYSRSTRSKNPSAKTTITNPPTPRSSSKPLRPKRIDQLRSDFHDLFDKADAFKNDVIKSKSKTVIAQTTAAFASSMVRINSSLFRVS
jgi:outer membrane murein-binding lipoprotein Lpp